MYKAIIDIGGYEKGEEVPAEQAILWNNMYKEPVAEVAGETAKEVVIDEEEEVFDVKDVEEKKPIENKSFKKKSSNK